MLNAILLKEVTIKEYIMNLPTSDSRITSLEKRVTELEAQLIDLQNRFAPVADGRGTLRRAMDALGAELKTQGITFANHGRKGRYVLGKDGEEHEIYLATSRNYGRDSNGLMSGWHTINQEDADTGRFAAYVLSVEDEQGRPVFFVIDPTRMGQLLEGKIADKRGLKHLYIGREQVGVDRYVDRRADPEVDFTPFVNNWKALEV